MTTPRFKLTNVRRFRGYQLNHRVPLLFIGKKEQVFDIIDRLLILVQVKPLIPSGASLNVVVFWQPTDHNKY